MSLEPKENEKRPVEWLSSELQLPEGLLEMVEKVKGTKLLTISEGKSLRGKKVIVIQPNSQVTGVFERDIRNMTYEEHDAIHHLQHALQDKNITHTIGRYSHFITIPVKEKKKFKGPIWGKDMSWEARRLKKQ